MASKSVNRKTNFVNPDLQKERRTGTFQVQELSELLHGGQQKLLRKKELETQIFSEPIFQNEDEIYKSRSDNYITALKKSVKVFQMMYRGQWSEEDFQAVQLLQNLKTPIAVHAGMFIPAIERLCTDEQKEKWLPLAKNLQIIGTYAQTELGHGTNLRKLETQAVLDSSTDEFVMNTPHLTSMKWWPGGLGKSSTHAVVLAQLIINRKQYGLHPFIVQLRSLKDHTPLPGITVGDIGPKIGINSTDNGFLAMKDVRIPRMNMMMRNARVSRSGQYSSSGPNVANYATLVYVRVNIVKWSANFLQKGATIAVRYSAVRRQSQLKAGGEELQIMSYQSQQYKLFPALASGYAYFFVEKAIGDLYQRAHAEIMAGNNRLLAELHSQSSCMKAHVSEESCGFQEVLRRSLGGHGYLAASGIPEHLSTTLVLPTGEGENTVLYQQTARFLMKQVAKAQSGEKLASSASYLASESGYSCPVVSEKDCRNLGTLLDMYRNRTYSFVTKTAHKLHDDMSSGMPQDEAWNNNMVQLVKAAKIHAELFAVECFVTGVKTVQVSPQLRKVLHDLCCLYGLYGIAKNSGDFMLTGCASPAQLELLQKIEMKLLGEIRPNAVSLVDAFAFHDIELKSALGCYDGNVYERLYQTALREPLNSTEVHSSYSKCLRDVITGGGIKSQL